MLNTIDSMSPLPHQHYSGGDSKMGQSRVVWSRVQSCDPHCTEMIVEQTGEHDHGVMKYGRSSASRYHTLLSNTTFIFIAATPEKPVRTCFKTHYD